jgi:hypothetical protein
MFIDEARKVYGPQITLGEILGYLPDIVLPGDPRPVREQLDDRYSHGGGYREFGRGQWEWSQTSLRLKFPGDPAMKPLAALTLPASCEIVFFYPHQMLLIVQRDSSFTVTRVD